MPTDVSMRGVRMPDELYLKLKSIAQQEGRSYNQQAVYILKKFVENYEKEHGKITADTTAYW